MIIESGVAIGAYTLGRFGKNENKDRVNFL